jgi:hypothetical protein
MPMSNFISRCKRRIFYRLFYFFKKYFLFFLFFYHFFRKKEAEKRLQEIFKSPVSPLPHLNAKLQFCFLQKIQASITLFCAAYFAKQDSRATQGVCRHSRHSRAIKIVFSAAGEHK